MGRQVLSRGDSPRIEVLDLGEGVVVVIDDSRSVVQAALDGLREQERSFRKLVAEVACVLSLN